MPITIGSQPGSDNMKLTLADMEEVADKRKDLYRTTNAEMLVVLSRNGMGARQ